MLDHAIINKLGMLSRLNKLFEHVDFPDDCPQETSRIADR